MRKRWQVAPYQVDRTQRVLTGFSGPHGRDKALEVAQRMVFEGFKAEVAYLTTLEPHKSTRWCVLLFVKGS